MATFGRQENGRSASFLEMYRYAGTWDYGLLAGGILSSVLNGFLYPLNALILKGITDTLIHSQTEQWTNGTMDYQTLFSECSHYVWMYVLLGMVMLIFGTGSCFCLLTASENQALEFRKRYLAGVMRQDAVWFDRQQPGTITGNFHDDIDRMKEGTGDKIASLIKAIAQMIGGIFLGLCLSWELTLVMLIVAPLLVASLVVVSAKPGEKERLFYAKAGAIADEVLSGIWTVTAYNAQYFEVTRYESALKIARRLGIRRGIFTAGCRAILTVLAFCAIAIGFWIGIQMTLNEQLTPGTIFACFWTIFGGALALGTVGPNAIGMILAAKLAVARLLDVIDREPEIDCTGQRGRQLSHMEGRIEFTNVRYGGDSSGLNGISFVVEPGQSVALVGAEDSGISSIFDLLLRFYDQDSGTVTLDGIPLRDLNVHWLRNSISMVQSDPVLFATTVERNLKMAKDDLTETEVQNFCKMANAHNFIMQLPGGYKSLIGEGSAMPLTDGQKQRIAFAIAFARQSKILLLKRATSGMDTESEQLIQIALDKSKKRRTTLTIPHRLSMDHMNYDKIIVFDDGRIAETGTHEQLLANHGVYWQLVNAQQEKTDKAMKSTPEQLEKTDKFNAVRRIRTIAELRQSFSSIDSSTNELEREIERKRDQLANEGASEANLSQWLRFIQPELPIVAIGFGFALLHGLTWPIFAVIYGKTFRILSYIDSDAIGSGANWNSLSYGMLGIISAAGITFSGAFFATAGERLALRLRLAGFQNILRQDGEFFDQHSPDTLCERLAIDAGHAKAVIDQRVAEAVQGLLAIIVSVLIVFFFGWNLTMVSLITGIMLIAGPFAITQFYLKHWAIEDADCADEAARIAYESIEHYRTVQALTRQRLLYTLFTVAIREPHHRSLIRSVWKALAFGLDNSRVLFQYAIAYGFITVTALGFYGLFRVIETVNLAFVVNASIGSFVAEFVRARICSGLLFALIERSPKIDSLSESGNRDPVHGDVIFRDLSFSYGQNRSILHRFNLTASFGRTIGLVGPSGCGKSTVIQLLERFYDYNSGAVLVDGKNLRNFNVRHLRSQMAPVDRMPTLFNLTIKQNITYGMDLVTQAQIEDAAKLANIHQWIIGLPEGYETMLGGGLAQLSRGQKQRIAIARAIVRNPKILLFNDPISGLDPENASLVLEALDRARTGRTCITIAHHPNTVRNADLIVVVRNGKVFEFGSHVQLLARKGWYYRWTEKQKNN